MRIHVKREGAPFHFVATGARDHQVHMDEPPEKGGTGQGASPMQMLIMAMGGCSGIDIVMILEKQRQTIDSFEMEIDAERPPGVVGAPYHKVHAHYILTGEIDPAKARRAVQLSVDKYCGVSNTLRPTAEITASVSVNGERFEVTR
ncbi:MAG TPA: OsmC family protein [Rhodothermales bacterium]|nr:OsmC family protein [Rhodothermales bacterium]